MTRFLIGVAALALAATPATAQLLGGGGGGGGGVGGGLGGVGGTATGSLNTMGRVPVDSVAAQARAQARQQARLERKLAERERKANLAGGATATAGVAGQAGSRSLTAGGTLSGGAVLGAGQATRGTAAAARNGLRQTGTTASGVAVYAPASATVSGAAALSAGTAAGTGASAGRARGLTAAAGSGMRQRGTTASGVAVYAPGGYATRSYPAYSRDYYYGGYGYYGYYGPDVVYVEPTEVRYYVDRQYVDLDRDLRGTGAVVERRGDNLVVLLPADVTFATNSADIRPQFYGALSAFARSLSNYPASDVEIVGHTDAVGAADANLALSDRRGGAVADFLVARGVDPRRLVVEAMGESRPLEPNATAQGRAANRRVEFIIHPRES